MMQMPDKRIQIRNNTFLFFIMIMGFLAACNPYSATPIPNPEPAAEFALKPVSDKLELINPVVVSKVTDIKLDANGKIILLGTRPERYFP
jgi:hypothetical protein